MDKSITQVIEEVKEEMCDGYCKYPSMPVPEGKNEDWLYEAGSVCDECPLNKL